MESENFSNNFITEIINSDLDKISDKKIQDDHFNSLLKVDNAPLYLFNIARKKRSIFKGKIIAVTGSIGKTSVKEQLSYFLNFIRFLLIDLFHHYF